MCSMFIERLSSKHHLGRPATGLALTDTFPFIDHSQTIQSHRMTEERKGSEGKEKQRLFCMLLQWARWVVCLFI